MPKLRCQVPCLAQLEALYALWDQKRGSRPMPARRDFDVTELRPWFGHIALLDVIDEGRDFRFRLYGTTLVAMFGLDGTGRRVSELAHRLRTVLQAEYGETYRTGEPLIVKGRAVVARDRSALVHKIALPLSSGGTRPDMILSALYDGERAEPCPAAWPTA